MLRCMSILVSSGLRKPYRSRFLFFAFLFFSCLLRAQTDAIPVAGPTPAPSIVDTMLQRADAALAQGKIFSPDDNNAYLFYRAARALDATNKRAEAGLNNILLRESADFRSELKAERISAASRRLKQLRNRFAGNPLLVELEKELRAHPVKVSPPQPVLEPGENAVVINAQLLKKRSPKLIASLRDIATGLKQSHQAILIFAHSDADARWVYQVMRDAVPDYRIRGDIRIGPPKIRFLPPLD